MAQDHYNIKGRAWYLMGISEADYYLPLFDTTSILPAGYTFAQGVLMIDVRMAANLFNGGINNWHTEQGLKDVGGTLSLLGTTTTYAYKLIATPDFAGLDISGTIIRAHLVSDSTYETTWGVFWQWHASITS